MWPGQRARDRPRPIAGPAFVAMTLQVSAITFRAASVSGGEMRESAHEFEDTRRVLGRNGSCPGGGSGRLRQTYRSLGLWCALDSRSRRAGIALGLGLA